MERVKFIENQNFKKVVINNPVRTFTIVFFSLLFLSLIIGLVFRVNIKSNFNFSQPILYIFLLIVCIIGSLIFISPELELTRNKRDNSLVVSRINYIFIKKNWEFSSKDVILIAQKKFNIIGTKEEGIVRAYKPFLRYKNDGVLEEIRLFPGFYIFYVKALDWNDIYSWTKKEAEQISRFLGIKLKIE